MFQLILCSSYNHSRLSVYLSSQSQFLFDFDEILHRRLGPESKNAFVSVKIR